MVTRATALAHAMSIFKLSNGFALLAAAVALAVGCASTIPSGNSNIRIREAETPTNEVIFDPAVAPFDWEDIQLTQEDIEQLGPAANFSEVTYTDPSANVTLATTKRTWWTRQCKVIPLDKSWPVQRVWDSVQSVMEGGLIKTVPLAAPCYYGPYYNAPKCASITTRWWDSDLHDEDPSSIMNPFFQGNTCLPTENPNATCTLGGYPFYVINATNVAHVQLAVNLARSLNIRLVIKNTGHDFSGKSSGANSLSVWTHHFKGILFIPKFNKFGYAGPAFKIGSGVQSFEIYEAARKLKLMVVGGEGMTVGYAGGYIQGGGHSPLSSILGMGSDHVLEYNVVTADGRFVTANRESNPDLFWALRGGGGSTFGVVTSLIVKAHRDLPIVTTVSWGLMSGNGVSIDAWWEGVRAYMSTFPTMADAGVYSYFQIPTSGIFEMQALFCPNLTAAQVTKLIEPLTNKLKELNIPFSPTITEHNGFYPAWASVFPKERMGASTTQPASRLFPRGNFLDKAKFNATFNAVKEVIDSGKVLIAFNIAPTLRAGGVRADETAVNPAWRNTLFHAIALVSWAENATKEEIEKARWQLTNVDMKKWRDVSPGAGAYLGESDINEPDFQHSFWGYKYETLYALKQKFDPLGVFYAATAVGSEDWKLTKAGRLCPLF